MSRLITLTVLGLRAVFTVLAVVTVSLAQAIPFQGLLTDDVGAPLDGTYDLEFTLHDALSSGNPVGSPVVVNDINISGGIMNTELNFGDVFWEKDVWLAVGVRPGASGGAYEPITPRTPILWSPRATTANRLGSYVNFVPGVNPNLDFRSPYDMRFHLDDDNNQPTEWFSVFDGADNVLLRLQEGTSGNNVVQLPASSISPDETSAEAGIVNEYASSNTTITGQATIASATITLPTAGYVIAIATFRLKMLQGTGAQFAIAENTTVFPDDDITASSPSGTTDVPTSVVRVFSTTSGAKTYNFLAVEAGGTLEVNDPRLVLFFVPTSYGTVETSSAPPIDGEVTGGLSQADIDASRMASIEANQRRIERELAEIRERFEGLDSQAGKGAVDK